MQLVGSGNQSKYHYLYDASGSIVAGGTAQLILPQSPSRSFLLIQNTTSTGNLYVEFGGARATCAISGGAVSSFTVTNAGFNYTKPPLVRFIGGGNAGNSSYLGLNIPMGEGVNSVLTVGRPAKAHAVLTAGAVSSIVLDDGGAGYVIAPFVQLLNSDLDPYGVALPAAAVGVELTPVGGNIYKNGTSCTTDAISIFGATTGMTYTCKWMT